MKKLGKRLNGAKETVETYNACISMACRSVCTKYNVDNYDQGKYIAHDHLPH